jgi:hypothetical protein
MSERDAIFGIGSQDTPGMHLVEDHDVIDVNRL